MSRPKAPPVKAEPPRCGTCRHYRPQGDVYESVNVCDGVGFCTRYPPMIVARATAFGPLTTCPIVKQDSACGEYAPRSPSP